jgi:natural resistance-associated macrophage protein
VAAPASNTQISIGKWSSKASPSPAPMISANSVAIAAISLAILIGGFVGVITRSYLTELLIAPACWSAIAAGAVIPRLEGAGAMLMASGIVGATILPHAI